MPTRIPLIRRGNMLLPANDEARETLAAIPEASEVAADIVQLRNAGLHKKAFAYVKLAFDYWSPKNHLTAVERKTVAKLGGWLVDKMNLEAPAVSELCKQFLMHLDSVRAETPMARDFDAFREFITVEAGYCHTVITPAGPRRVAKSWAWKNMSEAEFQQLFAAIRAVCWELVLSQTFESIEAADAVAAQLMEFD